MSVEYLAERGIPGIIQRAEVSGLSYLEPPSWALRLKESKNLPSQIILSDPLSYCAGVERADNGLEYMFDKYKGQNIFLYHWPIHNETKANEWKSRGGILVNNILGEVPFRAPVFLSAHGVSLKVWRELEENENEGIDGTCPIVAGTDKEDLRLLDEGYKVVLIGKEGHDEVVGLADRDRDNIIVLDPNASPENIDNLLKTLKHDRIAVRNQSTLIADEVDRIFNYFSYKRPDTNRPKSTEVCYATQNRQNGIIADIKVAGAQFMLIIGSDENSLTPSSNTIRQREVSIKHGVDAKIVEHPSQINPEWFYGIDKLGVSAGASAPPRVVGEFLQGLRSIGYTSDQIYKITVKNEPMVFAAAKAFNFSKAA